MVWSSRYYKQALSGGLFRERRGFRAPLVVVWWPLFVARGSGWLVTDSISRRVDCSLLYPSLSSQSKKSVYARRREQASRR